jgi:hypothetical protein
MDEPTTERFPPRGDQEIIRFLGPIAATQAYHWGAIEQFPKADVRRFWQDCALSGHPVVKYHDTDVGFLCLLPLSVFLKEDKGPDHDVLAASGVGGRGRVDTGSMERPTRDGAVGRRVIALEH